MAKQKTEQLRSIPFSNGSEFMFWQEENCCRCVKANWGQHDYNKTQKLVNLGIECPLKFDMELNSFDGTISDETAFEIGCTRPPEQQKNGRFCTLFRQCKRFSDKDDDKWKPTTKPIDQPDNQLCFPFIHSDIDSAFIELPVLNKIELI